MKWILLLAAAWLIWRYAFAARGRAAKAANPGSAGGRPAIAMRACAHCGLNVPEHELLHDAAGEGFCCEAHRRLGRKQGRA